MVLVPVPEKFGPEKQVPVPVLEKTLGTVTLCHVTMLLVTITMLNLKLSQTLPPGLDPLHVHSSFALEVLEHPAHQDQQGALYSACVVKIS